MGGTAGNAGANAAAGKGRGRRRATDVEPLFVTKGELARLLGRLDTATIDRWVRDGTFPPPHSRPGERTALWLRRHFEEYVRTGRWPADAYHRDSPG